MGTRIKYKDPKKWNLKNLLKRIFTGHENQLPGAACVVHSKTENLYGDLCL